MRIMVTNSGRAIPSKWWTWWLPVWGIIWLVAKSKEIATMRIMELSTRQKMECRGQKFTEVELRSRPERSSRHRFYDITIVISLTSFTIVVSSPLHWLHQPKIILNMQFTYHGPDPDIRQLRLHSSGATLANIYDPYSGKVVVSEFCSLGRTLSLSPSFEGLN